MLYNKPATTIQAQIQLLRQRGLAINDLSQAEHFLRNISYYRLEGYWWTMQSDKVNHVFKPNNSFDDVIQLYNFDRELRLLVFDVIERIEIGLRTRLIYHLSHEAGPWWFEDAANFKQSVTHTDTLISIDRELRQSKDTFIKTHYLKYHKDTRRPPAWKTLEVASFSTLSKLYGNLSPSLKSKDLIAAELNTVNHSYLPSWLQSIAQIRNICAHHGRLWNKNLPGIPKLLPKPPAPWLNQVPTRQEFHKLYIHVCCMKYLLDSISPGHHFMPKLADLFIKYPTVDLHALGFYKNWKNEPLWLK
ncbi:MAG: Abi family protein [Saprospiraceae bacterium]|nr:MAG: Abi family protein [Saprospiraceae bacterium]